MWPMGAMPLLSDQFTTFLLFFLPQRQPPLPPTMWGKMQDPVVERGVLDSSQRPPGVWGTLYLSSVPHWRRASCVVPQLRSLTHTAFLGITHQLGVEEP